MAPCAQLFSLDAHARLGVWVISIYAQASLVHLDLLLYLLLLMYFL